MSEQQVIQTEVCIIGAGPGGAAAALFLARKGIPCVVLDKARFPRDKVCGDALSGKVVDTLKKLDPAISDDLAQFQEALPCWGVNFVSPGQECLRVPFSASFSTSTARSDRHAPGYIATRMAFDDFLVQRLRKESSLIRLEEGMAVRELRKSEEGYEVLAGASSTLLVKTRLLLAADGAHSVFLRHLGRSSIEAPHYCAAIRAYYSGVEGLDKDHFIELHYLKEVLPGYLWIFPLPGGRANVGLGVRSDIIRKKKIDLKAMLPVLIERYFRDRFRHASLEGKVMGYGLPLGSKKRSLSGDHYMLIGDAASLIDPFTGEGIGNAMISGMEAAEQCERCLSLQQFSAGFMREYDRAVYRKLWDELKLSRRLQQLVNYPWLFNFIVRKANNNKTLQETISCMFEDLDMRSRLKDPAFYFKLLFT